MHTPSAKTLNLLLVAAMLASLALVVSPVRPASASGTVNLTTLDASMERKPGGYRTPSVAARVLSVISAENHQLWFQHVYQD